MMRVSECLAQDIRNTIPPWDLKEKAAFGFQNSAVVERIMARVVVAEMVVGQFPRRLKGHTRGRKIK